MTTRRCRCAHKAWGLALDAGLQFDSNTAIEDAAGLELVAEDAPAGEIRDAARKLGAEIPGLVDGPEDHTDEISELLADLRDACDERFTGLTYESHIEQLEGD
jgi:hypothetical protein